MRYCTNGHEVEDQFAFCTICGGSSINPNDGNQSPTGAADRHCASCGTAVQEGATFCGHCGMAIGSLGNAHLTNRVFETPAFDHGIGAPPRSMPEGTKSVLLPVLLILGVLIQFSLTGFAGLHGGSRLIAWFNYSQWDFNVRLLEFWSPFRWIHPVADLSAWRLRTETILLFGSLVLVLIAMISKQRRTRFISWLMLLILASLSMAASTAANIQSLALDFSHRSIYSVSRLSASNGGITLPSLLWLLLSAMIFAVTILGLRRNRK